MDYKVNRMDKINSEFKRAIYTIITKKLKNPLITEMVSIMDVDTSRDLSNANVYVSVFSTSEEKKNTTFNAIVGDAKKIKYELAHEVIVRKVPELHFILDTSISYGDKMDKLFLKIEKESKGEGNKN